jgi:apolipoprotein N-acyltransferase
VSRYICGVTSSRKQILVSLLAGLAHAGLMGLAFAPVEFGWAALVAIVPLVWVAVRMTPRNEAHRASRASERSEGRDGGDGASNANDASATSRLRERLYAGRFRKRDAVMVGLGASAFYWWQQQWVMDISAAGYVPLVLYVSIYPGLFVWVLSRLHGRFPRVPLAVLVPIVWTGLEWIRGEVVWDGYAWFLLGHPLIDTPLVVFGPIVGAYGVGAWLAACLGIACDARLRRRDTTTGSRTWAIAAATLVVALTVAMIAHTFFERHWAGRPVIRVGVVQTNLPQSNKIGWSAEQRERDFARFLDMTRKAAAGAGGAPPAVIIWPETMFPGYFLEPLEVTGAGGAKETRVTRYTGELLEVQKQLGVPLLIGALGTRNLRLEPGPDGGRVAFDERFNSVFRVEHGAVDGRRYDKIRMTPFGETMPYISSWPWLEKKLLSIGAAGMSFDLGKGRIDGAGLFGFDVGKAGDIAGLRGVVQMATPICFEITEASLCRALVRAAEADNHMPLLVNVTNDGWFGSWDPGRKQHLLAARWRALELGVPVVRAANTGVSCFIDYLGRVREISVDGLACRVEGIAVQDVRIRRGETVYREFGDLCWVFPVSLAGLVILAIVRRMPNNLGGGSGTETAKVA